MKPSPAAIRAARRVFEKHTGYPPSIEDDMINEIALLIEQETHCGEMAGELIRAQQRITTELHITLEREYGNHDDIGDILAKRILSDSCLSSIRAVLAKVNQ